MPFLLRRGQPNQALEVQRWQYFLHRQGINEVGTLDAEFGQNTERATALFQRQNRLAETGALDASTIQAAASRGYTVVADDHYDRLAVPSFPARPAGLSSPTHESRTRLLGCYVFSQPPRAQRSDPDGILIKGACDGSSDDWERDSIVRISIPEMAQHPVHNGTIRVHRLAEPGVRGVFAAWARADLLHLIVSWDGSFVARYKRTTEGSRPEGHGDKLSRDVPELSNHAFGTAFDINASLNPFRKPPAPMGAKGCVMELVQGAAEHGFFWGGFFSAGSRDGMHFEMARPEG